MRKYGRAASWYITPQRGQLSRTLALTESARGSIAWTRRNKIQQTTRYDFSFQELCDQGALQIPWSIFGNISHWNFPHTGEGKVGGTLWHVLQLAKLCQKRNFFLQITLTIVTVVAVARVLKVGTIEMEDDVLRLRVRIILTWLINNDISLYRCWLPLSNTGWFDFYNCKLLYRLSHSCPAFKDNVILIISALQIDHSNLCSLMWFFIQTWHLRICRLFCWQPLSWAGRRIIAHLIINAWVLTVECRKWPRKRTLKTSFIDIGNLKLGFLAGDPGLKAMETRCFVLMERTFAIQILTVLANEVSAVVAIQSAKILMAYFVTMIRTLW